MLGGISQISKYSMFSIVEIISFDCWLNGLNARFFPGLLLVLLCSGGSRTGESISGLPACGCDRALGQPSGAILGS